MTQPPYGNQPDNTNYGPPGGYPPPNPGSYGPPGGQPTPGGDPTAPWQSGPPGGGQGQWGQQPGGPAPTSGPPASWGGGPGGPGGPATGGYPGGPPPWGGDAPASGVPASGVPASGAPWQEGAAPSSGPGDPWGTPPPGSAPPGQQPWGGPDPTMVGGPGGYPPGAPLGPSAPAKKNKNALLIGGIAAGVVLVLIIGVIAAVAVFGKDDKTSPTGNSSPATGSSQAASKSPSAKPTNAPGSHTAPQEVCTKIDYSPLKETFGDIDPKIKKVESRTSSNEPTLVQCGQSLLHNPGALAQRRDASINFGAGYYKSVGNASKDYDYRLDAQKTVLSSKRGVNEVQGVGEKAFWAESDASSGKVMQGEVYVLDSNMLVHIHVLGSRFDGPWTDDQKKAAFEAAVAAAKATLPKL